MQIKQRVNLPMKLCDQEEIWKTQAMFTLYRTGFCSVAKVPRVQCEQELMFYCGAEIVPKRSQCEQELMFYCGAEIVPKRSQCEQKPYPSHNLQRCLLI